MPYYGKYRAKVVDVSDPEKRGRIRVLCPKVLGEAKSSWCEPCIPVAYDFGGDFAIPKMDEFVWVEFEEGNPNKPVYTGGLWCKEKSPSSAYEVKKRLITWGKCKITMTDDTLKLEIGSSVIEMKESKIAIRSSSITANNKEVARLDDKVKCDTTTGDGSITEIIK